MAKKTPILYPATIFNVFKPANMTSFDVVRSFKKNLPPGLGKIGHLGTLDPFASGVLLLAAAGASRINQYVHELLPKTYLAIGRLGLSSDTGDRAGTISKRLPADPSLDQKLSQLDPASLEAMLRQKFVGEYWQGPPAFSATKHQGVPLYQWAREGVMIEKAPVKRHIHDIHVVKFCYPFLSLRVTVSSGTYIRTLFEDCSSFLGGEGYLVGLLRESIGPLHMNTSMRRSIWPKAAKNGEGEVFKVEDYGLRPDALLPFSECKLDGQNSSKFKNGLKLAITPAEVLPAGGGRETLGVNKIWVYSASGPLIGMGHYAEGNLSPLLNFSNGMAQIAP